MSYKNTLAQFFVNVFIEMCPETNWKQLAWHRNSNSITETYGYLPEWRSQVTVMDLFTKKLGTYYSNQPLHMDWDYLHFLEPNMK